MTQPKTFDDIDTLTEYLNAQDGARIERVIFSGDLAWVKRIEVLGLRMALQKGNPAVAFKRELEQHRRLLELGAPVPGILAASERWVVTDHRGDPLNNLRATLPEADFAKILIEAARALAQLHQRGISHGRPSLKDMCWDGRQISFLDFERTDPARDTVDGHAEDLVIFVFNTLAVNHGPHPALKDAVNTYLENAPDGVLARVHRKLRFYRVVSFLTAPLRGRKRAWEFKAIPWTIAFFEGLRS